MAKVIRKSRTRQIVAATKKQAFRAVSKAIETGEETMHRLVPKDTGFLDSSIQSTDDGNGSGEIRVEADYGIAVEYGHATSENSIPAQPYFRPGLEDARTELKNNLRISEK